MKIEEKNRNIGFRRSTAKVMALVFYHTITELLAMF